jgi:hypothetical protein
MHRMARAATVGWHGHRLNSGCMSVGRLRRLTVTDEAGESGVTDRLDRMFAEVDRQLQEVREQCNSIATRSGLLISASAVAAGVLVANLDKVKGGEIVAFTAVGLATLAGLVTLVPGLVTGPDPVSLTGWGTSSPAQAAVSALYSAKLT